MSWFNSLLGIEEKIEKDYVPTDSLENLIKKISTQNKIISVERDNEPLRYIWDMAGLRHSDFPCGECGSKEVKIKRAKIKYKTPEDKTKITEAFYGCFCGNCGKESKYIKDVAPGFEVPELGKNIAGGNPYSYF